VRIEDINISYWARHFTGARRVPELGNGANGNPGAGATLLASLTAKLSGQAGHAGTPMEAQLTAPLPSASLNPSGLVSGSTLPTLQNNSVAGFVPMRGPLARPMADR